MTKRSRLCDCRWMSWQVSLIEEVVIFEELTRVLANDGGRATTRETARRARGDRAQAEISEVSRFWNMGTLLIESTSCPATVWSVKSRECVLAWRGRLRFWIGAHLLIRRESHEVSCFFFFIKWTQSLFLRL